MWPFFVFSGVTGLVSTDEKNARNIDVDLWAMTNQETGEYGVSHGFIVSLRVLKVILAAHEDVNLWQHLIGFYCDKPSRLSEDTTFVHFAQ